MRCRDSCHRRRKASGLHDTVNKQISDRIGPTKIKVDGIRIDEAQVRCVCDVIVKRAILRRQRHAACW